MGDREQQRKFAQNSNIKNSEYDRQNTNVIGVLMQKTKEIY
ncbi:hypothetical protein IGJ55_000139 [Enterococcus sp. AZ170]